MIEFLLFAALLLVMSWAFARWVLRGKPHEQFDHPQPEVTGERAKPSAEHQQVAASVRTATAQTLTVGRKELLPLMRKTADAMGAGVPVDGEVRAVDIAGLSAEWVLVKGADPDCRMLYLHGGAFTMGSRVSHRAITTEYSRRLGVAVLAIDYRLMPENSRRAGIEDCQNAYRWILENGPVGPGEPRCLLISGDSAGGNLTLMTIAWARDERLRAPDAAIALSPATDGTFTNPKLKANLETDLMLGPMFGRVLERTPQWLMLWSSFWSNRMMPANPLVSPLHGDLRNLPPTLLHASTAEMLEGDSVRYANKARSCGSPVEVALWPFMLHVWHAFVLHLPEAQEAFDHIEAFARKHVKALAGTVAH